MAGVISASKNILEASNFDLKIEQAPNVPVLPGVSPNPLVKYILHKGPINQSSVLVNKQILESTAIIRDKLSTQVEGLSSQIDSSQKLINSSKDIRLSYGLGIKVIKNLLDTFSNLDSLIEDLDYMKDVYLLKLQKRNGINHLISLEQRDTLKQRIKEFDTLFDKVSDLEIGVETVLQEIIDKVNLTSPEKADQLKKYLCDYVAREEIRIDFPYYKEELSIKEQINKKIFAINFTSSFKGGGASPELYEHASELKSLTYKLNKLPLKYISHQCPNLDENNKQKLLEYYTKHNKHVCTKANNTLSRIPDLPEYTHNETNA